MQTELDRQLPQRFLAPTDFELPSPPAMPLGRPTPAGMHDFLMLIQLPDLLPNFGVQGEA